MNLKQQYKAKLQAKANKEMPFKERLDQFSMWTFDHKMVWINYFKNEPIFLDLLDRLKDKSDCPANFAFVFAMVAKQIGIDMCMVVEDCYDFVRRSPIWAENKIKFGNEFKISLEKQIKYRANQKKRVDKKHNQILKDAKKGFGKRPKNCWNAVKEKAAPIIIVKKRVPAI